MAEGEERPDRSLRGRRMLNTGRTFRPAQKPKACRRHDSHIRRTLTDVTEVRHHAIMPGRLLRVRFPWATPAAGRVLGVVCAYQHAWAPKDTHILEKRHDFLAETQSLHSWCTATRNDDLWRRSQCPTNTTSPTRRARHGRERAPDADAAHTLLTTTPLSCP